MAQYFVLGKQTGVTSAYKTAAQMNATGTNKRGKVVDIMIGAASNPNATDTYVQWDVSRITATGAGAYTAFTPNPTDPADGAAVNVSGVNATAEATTITANSSIWNETVNQRGAFRWQAVQESQALIWAATAGTGLILRAQSVTFTAEADGSVYFIE
jgi:hypothetical protein